MSRPCPCTEIEWLVATAFNHGIDYYARADEEACCCWAMRAMDLAALLGDGGALAEVLRTRFAQLRFQRAASLA
ncbi:hypothetical protein CDD81_4263 [Ophiocordyceps australis]|uniref:Uncharacterized protein n=1 Tax=Ophiocordyceps australis TaxID=1399860 RepID=A0A2C5XQY6_9HYPO|nr:hypothetical protein CDD81_4263 [Ophiocordyceps australis]